MLVTLAAGGLFWRDGATGSVLATAVPLTRPKEIICSSDGRHALAFGDGAEVWDTTSHTGRKLASDWVGWAAWGPHDRVALAVRGAFEIWRFEGDEPAREHRRVGWTGVIAWRRDGLIAADIRAYRRRDDLEETGLVELRAPKLRPGRWLTVCYPDSLDHCPCRAAAWSPDGRRLAAIVEVSLQVVEVEGNRVRPARIPLNHLPVPRAISWSPDSSALASADREGVTLVRMRDGATIRLREEWDGVGLSGVVEPNSLPRFLGATR